MNHFGTNFRSLSKYPRVDKQHEIRIEYQEFCGKRHAQSTEKAYLTIPKVIKQISGESLGD